MQSSKALIQGLKPTPDALFQGSLFWIAGLLPTWIAAHPFAAGLHTAMDASPVAKEIASGGGMDLLAELGMRQPGLFGAGFSMALVAGAASLLLALYLTAGAYGHAAEPLGPAWRRFWSQGARMFFPGLAVLLLNGLAWGIIGAIPLFSFIGAGVALKESTDPAVDLNLLLGEVAAFLILLVCFRATAGFGRAWYALAAGKVNAAKSFLSGLRFALRRTLQVQPVTWGFLIARWGLIALAAWKLSPGYASDGAIVGSFVIAQIGFFAAGYLRVAEIRWQTALLGELPAEMAKESEPAPLVQNEPSVPEASDEAPPPEEDVAEGLQEVSEGSSVQSQS